VQPFVPQSVIGQSLNCPKEIYLRYLILILLLATTAFTAVQPSVENNFFDAPVTESDMIVDGLLSEPFWSNALQISVNYEITPGDNIPAPVKTTAYLTYNKDALLIGFDARDDNPSAIRANLADRDAPHSDDFCGIIMDTFNDEIRAYEFMSTAAGIQMDTYRNEQLRESEDPTWDAIWQNASQITENGYQTEIRIPWRAVRFPNGQNKKTFGFHLFRSYPRDVRYIIGAVPEDRNIDNLLVQTMKISGFENISAGKNIEIQPTFTAQRNDSKSSPDQSWDNGQILGNSGISARWGITPNISFNGTINPDFSQIEADELKLQINTKYALYYKEKRPFFMEGASILKTPFSAVYTRSIAEPLWGAKVSGKQGANSFSVSTVRDQQTNILLPSNEGSYIASLEEENNSGIVRYIRDIGNGSSVGFLGTAKVAGQYSNYVAGIDGIHRINNQDWVKWQFLTSETEYPDAFALENEQQKSLSGDAMVITAGHEAKDWTFWSSIKRTDKGLRADNGFIRRVDTKSIDGGAWRKWKRDKGWFTSLGVGLEGEYIEDTDGQVCDRSISLQASYNGPLQTGIWTMLKANEELYDGKKYDMNFFMLHAGFHPTGSLFIGLGLRSGDAIDYANGRAGSRLGGGPRIDWKITDNLQFYTDLTHEQLDVDDEDFYTVNMLDNRLVYHFSKQTFVRATVQYTHTNYDSSVDESLFTQLLFSHKVNPQTVLFLGYSDNIYGDSQWDMFRTDKSFFMKAAYAWQP
jgi:hypothetical protein